MEVLMKDLYCYECSMQFYKENLFNIHLSFVHGKELEIKQELDFQDSVIIPEAKVLEIKDHDEEKMKIKPKLTIIVTSSYQSK